MSDTVRWCDFVVVGDRLRGWPWSRVTRVFETPRYRTMCLNHASRRGEGWRAVRVEAWRRCPLCACPLLATVEGAPGEVSPDRWRQGRGVVHWGCWVRRERRAIHPEAIQGPAGVLP